jgi:translation initiation factor IF-3
VSIAISKRTDSGNRSRGNRININRNIRAKEVRVIDPDGNQIGVIPTYKAIAVANDFGLDLVEISPNAAPPVCKIMDYGRYKYETTKKKQEAKKKQTTFQLKEIKIRPKTCEHDLNTKINHIAKFLDRKDKVKVTVIFRGREITLTNLGRKLLEKIVQETEEIAIVEQPPKFEGRTMVMVLAPKPLSK